MVSVSARLTTKRNRWTSVICTLLLTAFALAVWPANARAQYFPANSIPDTFNDQSTSGVVLLGRKDGLLGPYADTGYFGPYLHLQHIAGDGPGYRDNGFTTIGLFAPRRAGRGMMFFDGRLSVNDFGNMIGNVGGGYRIFNHAQNRMYGGSLWYDVDSGHRSTFSQGGVSFETRGEHWDFFLNGYFPWSDDTKEFNRIVTPTGISNLTFTQNFLAVNRPNLVTRQIETAMTGFDAEYGGPLPVVGKYGIRGYGGYYHYGADNITDINGGRLRLQADMTDSLTGQFMLTNDNQFDTSVIFALTWSMPGNGASRSDLSRPGFNRSGRTAVVRAQSPSDQRIISQYYRMFQPTQRSQRVFVANRNEQSLEDNLTLLTDPTTGQPIVIFHMDSRAAAGGNGTFTSPFANPQEAQAGTGASDIIFTHAGSVFDNPANNFIALQENQQLLGEGVPHIVNTEQFGMVAIPPSGDAGGLPVFQNAGGPAAVTLANGSRLSGFELNNSGTAGILANAGLTAGNSALVENTAINGGPIGLNVMNAAGIVNFATTSSINNTTVAGLNVTGAMTTGTVNVDGTINNAAGRTFFIDNLQPGGAVNINGQVTATGGIGSVVQNSAGNVTVANANLMNIAAGNTGVLLDNNPNGNISFGRIDVMTNGGPAFVARDSGIVSSAAGDIVANGGPALFLDNDGTMNPFLVNLRFNSLTSNNSNDPLSMSGIHIEDVTGIVTVAGTAQVNAPMGNGLEFIDSDADVTFATLNINDAIGNAVFLQDTSGAAPDLLTGTLTVGNGLIQRTVDGSDSFRMDGGSANVDFGADINHGVAVVNNNAMVNIMNTTSGTTNFTGTLTANDGTGVQISNVPSTVNFLGTTTLDGGDAGVDILMGSTGTFTFSNMTSIVNPTGIGFNILNSTPQVIYDGTIVQNNGAEAVRIDGLGAASNVSFNDEVEAGNDSLGVRIVNSGGNVFFANYNNVPNALDMSTSLTLTNNTGNYEFRMLDIRTTGDGNLGIDANNGGTLVVGGALVGMGGSVETDGETAISIQGGTQLGIVNFNRVQAVNTVGGGMFDGVFLSDIPAGGVFNIDNNIDGDTADLMVNGTAGGDGFRAVNVDSVVIVDGADIFNTASGDGIEINGGVGTFTFGTSNIGNAGAGMGLGGGVGVRIVDTNGTQTFLRTDIENTGGGDGIRASGLGMNNLLTFSDSNTLTPNDVRIDDTAGGDGINISNTMFGSVVNFGGVNITNTGGGDGVEIGNGGMAGMGVNGAVAFSDGNPNTSNDLIVNGTGGGDGIHIEETLSNALVTFSSVDIDNTAMGDGINISNMADGTILFTDLNTMTGNDVQITNTGGGDGIEVTNAASTLFLGLSTVDINNTAMGHGVNINNTGASIFFGDGDSANPMPDLVDLDIDNTGGGDGIHVEDTLAALDLRFSTVDINNTGGGNGVRIFGNGATALGSVMFGDGDNTTTNDLNITNTGGGDGIDILNTGGQFTFSSVDIDGTMGGIGLDIEDAAGTISFTDGSGLTNDDLRITNTGGGDGIEITNSTANFTFSSVDISNTGAGNGIELISIPPNFPSSNIVFSDGDIRNADGSAFRVQGGANNINYNGSISMNDAGLAVEIVGRFGGTVTFGNSVLDVINSNGPMAQGISIIDDAVNGNANTVRFNSTVNMGTPANRLGGGTAVFINHDSLDSLADFNGPLNIATDSQIGLQVLNGGDIDVASGSINNTGLGATGVDIDGSATAVDMNINFSDITIAGIGDAANGLQFNNTTGVFNVANDTSITAAGVGLGTGIDIIGGNADYAFGNDQFDSLTITGATPEAIDINGLAAGGSFTVRGDTMLADDGMGGPMMNGLNVDGGAPVVTFGTTVGEVTTITNATADGVVVMNTTGGTVTFANLENTTSASSAIALTNNVGNVVVNAGNLATAAGSTDPVIDINMGTGNFTFNNGTVTQNNNGSTVSVTDGMAGQVVTFNAASTINATNGDGLQFDNADGTYNFNGTATLNGGDAGIDILNGSAGTFTFTDTDITSPTGPAFNIADSTAMVTFGAASSITQANNAAAVNVTNHSVGTLDFNNPITATNGTGLQFNNADGTYQFDGTVTLNGGDAGIDILGGSAGTFTFADTDITSPTGPAFNIADSTAAVTYGAAGSITQANNAAAVNVMNHSGGALIFNNAINATNGTGLQFSNADSVAGGNGYQFNGAVTLNGGDAGIDILNDSAGTFTFANTTITDPTGTAFNVVNSAANVNYNGGGITKTNAGTTVNITGNNGVSTISFAPGVTISAQGAATGINITGSTAMQTVNFNGPVNLGTTSTLTGGAGVNVDNGGQAGSSVNFNNLTINTTNQNALMATNGGTIAITGPASSIDVTNGIGVDLNGITSNIVLTGLEVTNSSNAFDALNFNNVGGTFTTASTTVNGAATRSGIDIDGGNAVYSFGTTEIRNTNNDDAIDIANTTGGSFTFGTTTLQTLDANFDGIRLTNNAGNFVLNGGPGMPSMITVGGGQHGILATQNNANGDITIANTIINGGNGVGGAGIEITSAGTSTFQTLIDNNTIGGSTPPFDGIVLFHSGSGIVDATVNRNTVTANGGDAFRVTTGAGSRIDLNLGSVGGQANTGLGNNINTPYAFLNNGDINLGVSGNFTAPAGGDIPDALLDDELNAFGNMTNGGPTATTRAGLNLIDAVLPNTVQMP